MDVVKDKRAAILDAALHLISVNGFHGTPMSKVASDAGVSAGIIYHYFESKDELIDELYRHVKRDLMSAILSDYQADLPVREQMRRIVRQAIRYFVTHPQETIFIEQFMRSPYNRPEIDAEFAGEYALIETMVQQAQANQIIKDLPHPVLFSLTLDVASSVAQKHAAGQLTLTDALVEQVVDACWDAVRQ